MCFSLKTNQSYNEPQSHLICDKRVQQNQIFKTCSHLICNNSTTSMSILSVQLSNKASQISLGAVCRSFSQPLTYSVAKDTSLYRRRTQYCMCSCQSTTRPKPDNQNISMNRSGNPISLCAGREMYITLCYGWNQCQFGVSTFGECLFGKKTWCLQSSGFIFIQSSGFGLMYQLAM